MDIGRSHNPYTNISGSIIDVSSSPFILTFDQLLTNSQSIKQREIDDLAKLGPFVNPSLSTLQPAFLRWATVGFPALYPILTISISQPPVCSDSVTRGLYDYISYLIGADLGAKTLLFNDKFDGMNISYSISGSTLTFYVRKS